MVGSDALGTGALNMNLLNGDNIWTSRLNINEDTNYPQLQFLAIHEDIEIRTDLKNLP